MTPTLNSKSFAVLAMAAAALAAGCGGGDPPDETLRDYLDGIVAGDGSKACDQLSDDLQADIEKASGRSCDEISQLAKGLNPGLNQDDVDKLDIDVDEDGDKATAKFKNPFSNRTETINLVKEDDAWKIASLQTRPQ